MPFFIVWSDYECDKDVEHPKECDCRNHILKQLPSYRQTMHSAYRSSSKMCHCTYKSSYKFL